MSNLSKNVLFTTDRSQGMLLAGINWQTREVVMRIERRIAILNSLYALYEETVSGFSFACGQHCTACCTCNVTCTTLEGWLVFDHLDDRGGPEALSCLAAVTAERYRPTVTLNQMASLCIEGREIPPEYNDPAAGACPWLADELCSLYAARPFGCRAMLSSHDCTSSGAARMPPFILSLNNVMMQYLEAIDRPGGWGNLSDVLVWLSHDSRRRDYESRAMTEFSGPLIANRPMPALMIPPEHRERMRPIVKHIRNYSA